MTPVGQLVAMLSLCLLAAVVNSQDPPQLPPLADEICQHYTQGGSYHLDLARTFDMLKIEFKRHIQTLNPMHAEQFMREVDDDHDKHLNMAECVKLIHNIHSSIKKS